MVGVCKMRRGREEFHVSRTVRVLRALAIALHTPCCYMFCERTWGVSTTKRGESGDRDMGREHVL